MKGCFSGMRSLKHWHLCTGGQSATNAVTYAKTKFCNTSEQNLPQSDAVRGDGVQASPHSDVHVLDQGGSCRKRGRGMGVCHDGLIVSFLRCTCVQQGRRKDYVLPFPMLQTVDTSASIHAGGRAHPHVTGRQHRVFSDQIIPHLRRSNTFNSSSNTSMYLELAKTKG